MRDFEKGKFDKKGKKGRLSIRTIFLKYGLILTCLMDFSWFYTDVSHNKGEKLGFFFSSGGCVAPPPERLRGMRPPTRIPPVSASVSDLSISWSLICLFYVRTSLSSPSMHLSRIYKTICVRSVNASVTYLFVCLWSVNTSVQLSCLSVACVRCSEG